MTNQWAVMIAALLAVLMTLPGQAEARHNGIVVNCDQGKSVAKALRRAWRGSTIRVRGTCHEQVVITRDDITLVAEGVGGFDGTGVGSQAPEFNALIRVRDATGVTLKGLFVTNSSAEGILIEGKATVSLEDLNVHDNNNVGVLVDHARVEVGGGTYNGNQAGIDATNGASLVLRGAIALQQNQVFGVAASNAATIEVRGSVIDASANGLAGVLLESGKMAIFNFGVSQGSKILANGNGLCGLVLTGGGFLDIVAPPPFQFSGINLVHAEGNGNCGALLSTGSTIESPFGAATFAITGNPVGMVVGGNSNVLVNGGLSITGNFGPGLVADGAGVITVAPLDGSPPPPLASEIVDNAVDVVLNFGSRATFAATVGSILCDGTALARGTVTCP